MKLRNLIIKGSTFIGIFALMLATNIQISFAAKYSITDKLIGIFNDIKSDLVAFSSAAAGVCIAVCLLTLLFTKNERATQAAWDWLKRIIICYVALMSITAILNFLQDFAVEDSGKSSNKSTSITAPASFNEDVPFIIDQA